jgi:proteasome lid subunit RPN8/RPN11
MSDRSFFLPEAMAREIIGHSLAEAPRECCGLIAGANGVAEGVYRLNNLAPGNELYEIDPAQLLDLEFRTLPAQGWEIVAIYHSHPHSPARPSSTDIALASWPEAVYLICSLEDRQNPYIRAFSIVDGAVSELAVRS